ncbi:sensor histidine kinase [Agitococcus lubricus]|uniref:histidine kinase n=1 Tax=Agitococcus lubricus TaxID=1077255 RepID=A0A2T5J356_9GAMM|nr:PAS domain S-box protein [Agitococcus lubricus]PTQ91057.1 PAS domain S-box-containing protein [Agitococcus lubricus]
MSYRVLLVENAQMIATDLQMGLEERGYDVIGSVSQLQEALLLAKQYQPDIALLDVMANGEQNSIELALQLTTLNIPFIFLTAYRDSQTLQWAARVHPYAVLTKPVDPTVLFVMLEQAVYQAKREQELRTRYEVVAHSEARLRAVFMDNPDAILVVNQSGQIVNINPRSADLFGYSEGELVGASIELLLPEHARQQHIRHRQTYINHPQLRPMGAGLALLARRADGTEFPVDVMLSPMYIEEQRLVIAIVRDVTERKAQEKKLNEALKEKDTLLKEVYHRVKNNLQVIQSLLNMESRVLTEEPARIALADIASRVSAMALVHEKLYQSGNLSRLSLAEYLRDLVKQLQHAGSIDSRRISISLAIDDIRMGIDTAIPLGLLINELVTNSLKHAFPEGRMGHISIRVEQQKEGMLLTIKDDGIGLPPDFVLERTRSMGLKLTRSLAKQLNGTVTMHSVKGTEVVVYSKL